jgi:hypothetical protein
MLLKHLFRKKASTFFNAQPWQYFCKQNSSGIHYSSFGSTGLPQTIIVLYNICTLIYVSNFQVVTEDSVDPDNMTYEVCIINALFGQYIPYCSIKGHAPLPADYAQLFLKGLLHVFDMNCELNFIDSSYLVIQQTGMPQFVF